MPIGNFEFVTMNLDMLLFPLAFVFECLRLEGSQICTVLLLSSRSNATKLGIRMWNVVFHLQQKLPLNILNNFQSHF